MKSCTISFYNEDTVNQYGMPTGLHSYFFIVVEGMIENSKIVSIISLTSSPAPTQAQYIYENCTEEDAFKKIEVLLQNLDGNKSLTKWVGE